MGRDKQGLGQVWEGRESGSGAESTRLAQGSPLSGHRDGHQGQESAVTSAPHGHSLEATGLLLLLSAACWFQGSDLQDRPG